MEPEQKTTGIMQFLDRSKLVLYTVLEFLNQQDLTNLYVHIKGEIYNQCSPILLLIQGYIYIRLHMNHTQRSFHFFVYDQPAFRRIQKSTIAFQIASTNQFSQFFHLRKSIQQFLNLNLQKADCLQLTQQIERLSDDPDIPMQRLLRQTVGVGCKSTFQNYLVSIHVNGYTPLLKECPKLSEFYQKRAEQAYITQFLKIGKSRNRTKDYQNIKKLHFAAYLIKCEDFKDHLLSDTNQMHNFIVGLFAMADLMVKSSAAYLQNIKDPYYLLLEYNLRYAIYRNFIISIQEKFGFAFEIYSYIYSQTFRSQKIAVPKFTFWRPAMSKWLIEMSRFHRICIDACNNFLLKQRHRNLIQQIDMLIQEDDPGKYLAIRIALDEMDVGEIFLMQEEACADKEMQEVIKDQLLYCVHDFVQNMMDVSIDQITVHWCGYTKQVVEAPFQELEDQIARINNMFYLQLLKMPCEKSIIVSLFQKDLTYICQQGLLRERIIARIILETDLMIMQATQNKLHFDFKFRNEDQKIKRFNQKAKIPLCIQNQKSRRLFQMFPTIEVSSFIQIKSISTAENSQSMDNSEISEFYQDIQYRSDDDEDQPGENKENGEVLVYQSFMEDQSCQHRYPFNG